MKGVVIRDDLSLFGRRGYHYTSIGYVNLTDPGTLNGLPEELNARSTVPGPGVGLRPGGNLALLSREVLESGNVGEVELRVRELGVRVVSPIKGKDNALSKALKVFSGA